MIEKLNFFNPVKTINFKTRGWDSIASRQDFLKFRMHVLVSAGIDFRTDALAHDYAIYRSEERIRKSEINNPNSRLIFKSESVDLHDSPKTPAHTYFYEFVGIDFYKCLRVAPTTFSGLCFVSGGTSLNQMVPRGLLTRAYEYSSARGSNVEQTDSFWDEYHTDGVEKMLLLRLSGTRAVVSQSFSLCKLEFVFY